MKMNNARVDRSQGAAFLLMVSFHKQNATQEFQNELLHTKEMTRPDRSNSRKK
jgi:hypothetical protein